MKFRLFHKVRGVLEILMDIDIQTMPRKSEMLAIEKDGEQYVYLIEEVIHKQDICFLIIRKRMTMKEVMEWIGKRVEP